MKRVVITVELPRTQNRLEIEIQEPGIIHGFVFALRQKKILSPIELPSGNGGAPVAEEVPVLMVEVDPEAPTRKRKLAIVSTGEIIEAEDLTFLATVVSRNGNVFHLFEGPRAVDA